MIRATNAKGSPLRVGAGLLVRDRCRVSGEDVTATGCELMEGDTDRREQHDEPKPIVIVPLGGVVGGERVMKRLRERESVC